MDSYKRQQSTSEEQKKREQERLRLKRKEWYYQQELRKIYKERRAQESEEYEKNRIEPKVNSSSEQSKECTSIKDPETTIVYRKKLRELKTITIINNNRNPTNPSKSTSKKVERDIIDSDSVVVPRRQNEGSCPIFDRSEIKKAEEIWTIKLSQDKQSEKQLPTNRKDAYRENRLQIIQNNTYCDFRSRTPTRHRNHRTDDNDRHTYDRRRGSPIRDSKEKDKDRNERRRRSSSRYSDRNAPVIRNRSRSRCRSRSRSPVNERVKEKRSDNDESKSSSRRNYSDRSRESDNCASSRSSTNYPPFCGFYNPYIVRLPGAMPMPRGPPMFMPRGPPMFMPILPGPFPPMNIRWQQPPPKFANNKEINGNPR